MDCLNFLLPAIIVSCHRVSGDTISRLDEGQRCLGSCLCYDSFKTVNCSGRNYDYVPVGIPTETTVLDLSDNAIQTVTADNLANLYQVKSIDLSYNDIGELSEQAFKSLKEITVLKIGHNADSFEITDETFASLLVLQELDLQFTPAVGMLGGVFTSLRNLSILNIDNTNVFPNSLTTSSFQGLTNLNELSIASSYLYEIPMNVMRPFQYTLKKLSMRFSSRFTAIGTQDTQRPDFPNLEQLDLSYSRISLIVPGAFYRLPKLKHLDLTGNVLNAISPGAFAGVPNLQTLDLSVNSLLTFPLGALQALSENLLELRLSRTYFSQIGNTTGNFTDDYLRNLELLVIEDGNLESVAEMSFFQSLLSLKYLSLAGNKLSLLPGAALSHLESLNEADFSGNPISSIAKYDIPKMQNLRHLTLSRTDLEDIDDDAFETIDLQTLKLDNNLLTSLSRVVLENQRNLTGLDISNNALQTPDVMWFRDKPLDEVLLSGNPWNCDCNMTEFYQWIKSVEYLEIDSIDTIVCDQPRSIKGYPLPLLQENDLTCEITECPSTCICTGASFSRDKPTMKSSVDLLGPWMEHMITRVGNFDSIQEKRNNPLDEMFQRRAGLAPYASVATTDCTGSGLNQIPKVPNATEYINVAQNSITHIRVGDVSFFSELQTFIASDNEIATIENGSFDGLSAMEIMYLNKNKLSQLDVSLFSEMVLLRELRIDDNVINTMNQMAFSGLSSLEILDLSINQITSLESGTFAGLANLRYLNLASNSISSIEKDTFQYLGKLQYLYLHDNNLQTLSSDVIQSNPNLEYLELSENSLGTIPENFLLSESLIFLKVENGYNPILANGSFSGLPNLKILHLRGGFISQIGDAAFSVTGESKLQTLDLTDNSLLEIPLLTFSELTNLESLGLGGNQIASIPSWTHAEQLLPKLTALYLSRNTGITDIPSGTFISDLLNLTALVINDCQLGTLPAAALSGTNLQYLIIDNNPITDLQSDISLLPKLKDLQFSSAYALQTVSNAAFRDILDLERVILSDGLVTDIAADAFQNLKNLEVVDLSNNRLTEPRPEWFSDLDPEKVKSILLYGNPWVCDCDAKAYQEWLDNGDSKPGPRFLEITCTSPQMQKGLSVSEVEFDEFCVSNATNAPSLTPTSTVPTPSEDCEKCTYDPNTKTGNCSYAELQSVPTGCFSSDIEKLDLSGNSIGEIRSGDLANLRKLLDLNLSENSMELISEEAFMDLPALSVLDLSSNLLNEIPSGALSSLGASLLVLKLDNQRISRLPTESFLLSGLVELSITGIRSNDILPVTIEDFAFSKLPSLKRLDLSKNAIGALGKNTLTGLHELSHLNMTATGLSDFPYTAMWRVPKLTELILDNNSIRALLSSAVPILESLERFSIRNNSLASIADNNFLHFCSNLQELDFGVNPLTKIPTYALTNKPKLANLLLDFSQIMTVNYCELPATIGGVVNLANSRITTIEESAFANLDQLTEITLNDNFITFVADNAYSNSGAKFIDMSSNQLEYISCGWIDGFSKEHNVSIDLTGNIFDCTCGMVGYRDYIGEQNYPSHVTVEGDVCSSPEELKGWDVEAVELDRMLDDCDENSQLPNYCG